MKASGRLRGSSSSTSCSSFAIDQLARRLQHTVTGHETLVYLALYGPISWAWVGFVIYTDGFGTDDISDRFMTLLQVGAALVIAAAALHATSERATAFAAPLRQAVSGVHQFGDLFLR